MRASVAKLIRLACYSYIWLSTLFPSMLRAETTKRAAQGHEPLSWAIEQVKSIKHHDKIVENRLKAMKAFTLVRNRVQVMNDPSGYALRILPFDFWNSLERGSTLKERVDRLSAAGELYGAKLGELAWDVQVGACEEHAAIMQTILKAAGVENVVTLRSDSPHAFVVVNLAPGADPDLPWTWGADTLIPDTWIGDQFNPEKAWRSRYIFGNGKYFVSSGKERLTTREKFWQFLDRSEDFLRQHCQEYKRLYEQTIKNNTYPVDKKQGWRIFQSKGKLPDKVCDSSTFGGKYTSEDKRPSILTVHGDSKKADVSGYIKREWIKPPKQFKFDFTAKFVGTLTAEGTYNQTQSIYVNGAGWRKDVIKGKITLELTGNKMKVRLEPSERNHYNDKTGELLSTGLGLLKGPYDSWYTRIE